MNQHLHKNHSDDLLRPKRFVFADQRKEPEDVTLAEEPGLEEPEKVIPEDSLEEIQKQIAEVYSIEDPDQFVDRYESDLIDLGIIGADADLPEDISVQSTNAEGNIVSYEVDNGVRLQLLHGLMKKFTERISEKGQREIESIPIAPGSEDVTQAVKSRLLEMKQNASQKDEAVRYQTLADTVASLGLKKEELTRTNVLTERSQALELQLKSAQARLKLLQDVDAKVKRLEDESKAKQGFFSKLLRASPSILGIGATALTAGLGFPPAALVAVGGLGSFALISNAIGMRWLDRFYGLRRLSRAQESLSITLQKELLKKGETEIKTGDRLIDFYIPEPPVPEAEDAEVHDNSLIVKKGGKIDGREVTMEPGEEAVPGSIVSGEIIGPTKVVKLEKSKTALEGEIDDIQQSFNTAKKELAEHTAKITHKKQGFMVQYAAFEQKVKSNEQSVQRATVHLAALRARKITEESTGSEKTEFDQASEALREAQGTLARSRKAMEELKRVKRVFDLNEEFAKTPVPTGMIDALYGESLNPELTALIKKLSKEQDKRTKAAQEEIGKASIRSLADMLAGFAGEEREDLLENINALLRKVGLGRETLYGKKTEAELLRLPEFRFLRGLRRGHEDLYKLLINVPALTRDTRYPKGPTNTRQNLCQRLISMFGDAARLLEREEAGEEDEGDGEDDEDGGGGGGRPDRGRGGPGEGAEPVDDALAEKRRHLRESLEDLRNPREAHLRGIYDILNENYDALRDFVREARDINGEDFRIPRGFGNASLRRDISRFTLQECEQAQELVDYIVEHAVVCQLNEEKTGVVREAKDATLHLKEKLASDVRNEARLFLSTLAVKIQDAVARPENVPALTFDHISSITISNSEWLKGGREPHDQKVLQDLQGNGAHCTFAGQELTESPERLELVLFSLEKLGRLLSTEAEQLTTEGVWRADGSFECNIVANQRVPVGPDEAGRIREVEVFFNRNYDRIEMRHAIDVQQREELEP